MNLRPKFLTHWGEPIRFRWWLVYQITRRLRARADRMLARSRTLLMEHHRAGRTSGEYLHGKRLADHARRFERWIGWLNDHQGAMYVKPGKSVIR